jgi:two-component system cell cycle sensor histidine kinase/response regulator CckA
MTHDVRTPDGKGELREWGFRTLVENSPDMISRLDGQCRFLYANPAAIRALGNASIAGILPTGVSGRTYRELGLPEDIAATSEASLRKVFETGEQQIFEIALAGRDGIRHYLARVVPEFAVEGAIESALLIHRDITERKRAEAALQESEAHYRELFSSAQRQTQELQLLDRVRTALAREDELPLIIRTVVEGIARSFGYTQVSLYMRQGDLLRCQHQVGYDRVIEEMSVARGVMGRVARTGEAVLLKDAHADPDFVEAIAGIVSEVCVPLHDRGRVVGVLNVESTKGVVMAEGDLRLILALAEHVSIAIAKTRLTAEARSSEERYRQLVEYLGEGVMIVDSEERIHLANPAAAAVFGMLLSALTGRTLREFLSDDEFGRVREQSRLRREGQSGTYELEISRPDGTKRRVQVSATPHRGEDGEFLGTLGTIHDVTETRTMESALRRSEERLAQAQKMEAVGRLAGGIAHDFNNLLTVISGYARMIEEGLAEDAPMKADIRQVTRAAGRAADLTARLLAFSRKQVLQPKVIDLNETVRGLQEMLRRVIGEDVELIAALSPETGNLRADRGQIEQVIINLAANARDAMPSGGTLIIETGNRSLGDSLEREQVEVKRGDYVMLAVQDTGVGMPPETLARLFEPFFTTKEVGKGTGLGLAMVYGIVKQSEGYIICDSVVEQGTTFTMYFPRVRQEIEEGTTAPTALQAAGGKETILLAEDEDAVRLLCKTILERNGYTVLEAGNGEEALAAAARWQGPVKLLLSDVVMPLMSGPEIGRRVREVCPDIRVLYMSGHADSSLVHHGILDPGVDLIEKPFESDDLLRRVREILDRVKA